MAELTKTPLEFKIYNLDKQLEENKKLVEAGLITKEELDNWYAIELKAVNEISKGNKDLGSSFQSFKDKMAELTLTPPEFKAYNIAKDIASFAPLIEAGLITPIQLATMAFKELQANATASLHATYYGIKENPLIKQ